MKKKAGGFSIDSAVCMSTGLAACSEAEAPLKAKLFITAPTKVVYPYEEIAKEYLLAARGKDVSQYKHSLKDSALDILIEWKSELENVSDYLVEYYSKSDKSDLVSVKVAGDTTSLAVRNLYKGASYQVSVSAFVNGKVKERAKSEFKTTDLGPRVMRVEGIYNVRDLGGYKTADGKTTAQGLVYRGGALTPYSPFDSNLTVEGKLTMSQTMGIKTELDLRGYGEESGRLTESPIPEAKIFYIKTDGYASAFTWKENFRQVFSTFADKNNYPIYMHCTGGADRTGTVSFLLNALLGVSETQLIQDYEFTSFSVYSERNSLAGTTYGTMFQDFLTTLKSYEGESLAEKTASYLLSIGVTQIEIDNIRAIMLEKTK